MRLTRFSSLSVVLTKLRHYPPASTDAGGFFYALRCDLPRQRQITAARQITRTRA